MKVVIELTEKELSQAMFDYAKKKNPNLKGAEVYMKYNPLAYTFTGILEGILND